MPVLWVFEADVFIVQKGLFAIKKHRQSFFSQFIFTSYYMGIQDVTRGYREIQRAARGYRGLQGVTRGYKG